MWAKVVEKVNVAPAPTTDPYQEGYYDNLILKPGGEFFKAIATMDYPLRKLRINIPSLLVYADGRNTWLFTSEGGLINKQTRRGPLRKGAAPT